VTKETPEKIPPAIHLGLNIPAQQVIFKLDFVMICWYSFCVKWHLNIHLLPHSKHLTFRYSDFPLFLLFVGLPVHRTSISCLYILKRHFRLSNLLQ